MYARDSWIDPRVELRASPIHGTGMFARTGIGIGEAVVVWGGTLVTDVDLRAGRARKGSVSAVAQGVYLVGLADEPAGPDDFMNHACDPTVWMVDEVTLATRRPVAAGEELTADYVFWEGDEDWVAPWPCRCGAVGCRGVITGRDWRLPALQTRYRGHFSPFIDTRIRRETA